MSDVVSDEELNALAAEYVLGTLDYEERKGASALLEVDPAFRGIVRIWERRFGDLHLMVESVEPDPQLWVRIRPKMGGVEQVATAIPSHGEVPAAVEAAATPAVEASASPTTVQPVAVVPASVAVLAAESIARIQPSSDAHIPTTNVPTADVPKTDVPKTDVPKTDVPMADVPMADVPMADVPMADVLTADVPNSDAPKSDVAAGPGLAEGAAPAGAEPPSAEAPVATTPPIQISPAPTPQVATPPTEAKPSSLGETDLKLAELAALLPVASEQGGTASVEPPAPGSLPEGATAAAEPIPEDGLHTHAPDLVPRGFVPPVPMTTRGSPIVVEKQVRTSSRGWVAATLMMALIAVALAGLISAWRFFPERLPPQLRATTLFNLPAAAQPTPPAPKARPKLPSFDE